MLGSHPISAVLGADISATSDTPSFSAYVKALSECGLHVMMCQRESKIPADYRTPKQKKDDLTAYAEETGDSQRADPPGGVHMATNDVARLRSYVKRYRKEHGDEAPVNLAIEVGNSALIVADCDTAAERAAFGDWWASKHGDERFKHALPTVLSPGVFRDGEWVHKDGGHFYFTVDGLPLPPSTGKMSVTHNGVSFDVFWRDRYVLIPPSVRAEGPYQRVGPVLQLSDHEWLHREITTYAASRQIRPSGSTGLSEHNLDALVTWYNDTSWSAILAPHGWEWTGMDKTCGCPIWGRPGGRSSDKSATSHEPGCSNSRYNPEDPPIHFWTSQPGPEIEEMLRRVGGGVSTLSKLQLFAAFEHNYDVRAALRSMPGMQAPPPRTRSVQVPGMPFCTSVIAEGDEDDDVIVLDSYSYDEGDTDAPYTPEHPHNSDTSVVTNPFTCAPTHTPPPTHDEGRSNSEGVLQKPLASPAGLIPSENFVKVAENLTDGATGVVTHPVPTSVTPTVTGDVTGSEALRYDERYETAPTAPQSSLPATPSEPWGRHLSVVPDTPQEPRGDSSPRHSVIPSHRRAKGAPPAQGHTSRDAQEHRDTSYRAEAPAPAQRPVSVDNPFSVLATGAAAAGSPPPFGTSATGAHSDAGVAASPAPTAPAAQSYSLSDDDVSRIAHKVADILSSTLGRT